MVVLLTQYSCTYHWLSSRDFPVFCDLDIYGVVNIDDEELNPSRQVASTKHWDVSFAVLRLVLWTGCSKTPYFATAANTLPTTLSVFRLNLAAKEPQVALRQAG
jgi:hypothetical protein